MLTSTYLLFSLVFAHTRLFSPKPSFADESTSNFPSECKEITFTNNAPSVNIDMFTSQLQSKFGGSLLKYFTACGSDSPKTDHNAQVPIPTDGMAKIDSHSQHPGLYEFYIDDKKVGGGTWQVGETPDSVPIDYSSCAGTCKFRYIMAAVHQQPIQLYDNIVTLSGSATGSGNSSPAEGKSGSQATQPTQPNQGNQGTPNQGSNTGNQGATAAMFAQCGGQGYQGPTACAAGSTCKQQMTNEGPNPYYSQCLP